MNSSIYTDVVEWMAKIVKPQKALGNVSICPYAKKASRAIVEYDCSWMRTMPSSYYFCATKINQQSQT